VNRLLQRMRLEQQAGQPQIPGLVLFHLLEQVGCRIAGIDDIFQQYDGAAAEIFFQSDDRLYGAGGTGARVRRQAHEGYFTRQVDLPEQVGGEKECTVQHGDEDRRGAGQVMVHGPGHLHDALLDPFLRNQDGKFLIPNLYRVLHHAAGGR
jgi:hypothetical protein